MRSRKRLTQIFGYKGKQVRDNIHSADLIRAFHEFFKQPRSGEVYNMGGGRFSNCSMMEAIELCEDITGNQFNWKYVEENRVGDHIWWISDLTHFQEHYPNWKQQYDVPAHPEGNLRIQYRTMESGMLDSGKRNVVGILINAVDYEAAVEFVVRAARERRSAAISALAVHGLMTGVLDREQKFRLNQL